MDNLLKTGVKFKGISLKISRAKKPKPKKKIGEYVNGATKIFVGGIPINVTVSEFMEYFSKYGPIEEITLPLKNKFKNTNKGHGFVNYKQSDSAKNAVNDYQMHFMRGKWVS